MSGAGCGGGLPYGAGQREAGRLPGLPEAAEGVIQLQEELSGDALQSQQVLVQEALVSRPSPVRPEAPPTGGLPGDTSHGPRDHLPMPTPQRRIKVNPRRGHFTAFGSMTHPCPLFSHPRKTNLEDRKARRPLVPPRPSSRPCGNWLPTLSVTEQPAPRHTDSTSIGPRPCPSLRGLP